MVVPGRVRVAGVLTLDRLAGATVVATMGVILLGAYTKAIGAGLSCPDWPTCYGTWVPFLHPEIMAEAPYTAWQVFVEWAHRGLAAVTGLLILATAIRAWRSERGPPLARRAAVAAAVLLPFQVVLGGLTVTESLEPVIVTAHLGMAVLVFAGLVTTTVAARIERKRDREPGVRAA
jgi:heme A synthase